MNEDARELNWAMDKECQGLQSLPQIRNSLCSGSVLCHAHATQPVTRILWKRVHDVEHGRLLGAVICVARSISRANVESQCLIADFFCIGLILPKMIDSTCTISAQPGLV